MEEEFLKLSVTTAAAGANLHRFRQTTKTEFPRCATKFNLINAVKTVFASLVIQPIRSVSGVSPLINSPAVVIAGPFLTAFNHLL